MKCIICGAYFTSKARNAKYCSPECMIEGAKRNRENWLIKNPDYDKNRMREYRKNNKLNIKKHKV